MPIETAWLAGTRPSIGIDQLGTRSNGIRMYGHLMPGINNVTDRIRYYSLHSYLADLWAKKRNPTDTPELFFQFLRRGECALGLAEKILTGTGDGSYAIVGTTKIEAWVKAQIAELGASSPADMGKVMKAVLAKAAGGADGNRVSALVKKCLS